MPPPPQQTDDAEIVRRLRTGDETALRMLIELHGPQVKAGLRRQVAGAHDEDLQEMLVAGLTQLWRTRERFDPAKGSLGAWFGAITATEAKSILRERTRQRQGGVPMDDKTLDVMAAGGALALAYGASPSPLDAGTTTHPPGPVTRALREIITGLSPGDRRIIEADLRNGETVDGEVLAKEFGISSNAIYSARSRARKQIKLELEARGFFGGQREVGT